MDEAPTDDAIRSDLIRSDLMRPDLIRSEGSRRRDGAIVVLAPSPWDDGGIARSTRTLLRALTDLYGSRRVGVLPVWAGSHPGGLRGQVLRSGEVRGGRERVPIRARVAYLLDALREAWEATGPGVLISAHAHLAPVAYLARLGRRHRTVVCAHGDEVWGRLPWSVAVSIRRADAVWAVSSFTAGRLRAGGLTSTTPVRVLPHAVSPEIADARAGGGRRDPLVLSVATLDQARRYKGVDTLLRAWSRVREHVPDAELLVVGDGDDRPRLEGIAEGHGIEGSVTFAGRVTDEQLARAYRDAALFALPGRARLGPDAKGEGFGLVFIEAAAAGLPVVAGRAGGATEAVRDGRTGLLVDPRDHGEVATGIVRLLTDRGLAREMGDTGRQWVRERFSFGRFRADVARLIGELGLVGLRNPVPRGPA